MDKIEKRLLHGPFYHRESVNEGILYHATELEWLMENAFKNHKNWQTESGKLQETHYTAEEHLKNLGLASNKIMSKLRYLAGKDYIKLDKQHGIRISVTPEGAEIARKLHSWRGRLDVWYREQKGGFLFAATALTFSYLSGIFTPDLLKLITYLKNLVD